jgi:hypothetical protein
MAMQAFPIGERVYLADYDGLGVYQYSRFFCAPERQPDTRYAAVCIQLSHPFNSTTRLAFELVKPG